MTEVKYIVTNGKFLTHKMLKELSKVSIHHSGYLIKNIYNQYLFAIEEFDECSDEFDDQSGSDFPICFATIDNKIVGQACLDKNAYGYHLNVFVFKHYRRQGIGKRLVKLLMKDLKHTDIEDRQIAISDHDDASHKFYKSLRKSCKEFKSRLEEC